MIIAYKFFIELQKTFEQSSDRERARQQQAYMKSSMPFWGIAKPTLDLLVKPIIKKYSPTNNDEYRQTIKHLFTQAQYREEWYTALNYARQYKKFITHENIDLYIEIVLKTQWWDIVDAVADHLIGKALYKNADLKKYLNEWILHENMWMRRTAIVAQLKYKKDTDFQLLSDLIKKTAHEKEFFIKKAIGWALREYSKTNPETIKNFIEQNRIILQPLSIKEGSKYI